MSNSALKNAIQRCADRGVVIPKFSQLINPSINNIPAPIVNKLKNTSLDAAEPANLFRITWKNEATEHGGLWQDTPNIVEFPSEITQTKAKIIGMVGRYFPTGAHKVGAGFGCLVPRLVTGEFDPKHQQAVFPSTGNYCRGGAFDCALLGCGAIAILPEEMSTERFDWLKNIGSDIIATVGSESNVKEIYDMCWKLRRERGSDVVIFNQFEEFGNFMWHYHVTGNAIDTIVEAMNKKNPNARLAGFVAATGSAGTIGAGDHLRTKHPRLKVLAAEALQCPTLYANGFGAHRIEGIGDKHVPWIHNVRNTDLVAAIDDEQVMSMFRLFNEPSGQEVLKNAGVDENVIKQLPLMGISCVCNLVAAMKMSKYYEYDENDIIVLPLTDSSLMYQSRLKEMKPEYNTIQGERDYARYVENVSLEYLQELNFQDRKRLHNLKYFTWVEQQARSVEELNELWTEEFWTKQANRVTELDDKIDEFNEQTGVLKSL